MGQDAERNPFRTDFVLLLHLSIIVFFLAGWLVFVLIMVASGNRIYWDMFEFLMLFIFPLVLSTFLSVIAVALSNILRQKWWIALFGTILLLGTPLIAFVITWIGKQIARFFYLATPSDLAKTKLVLNMKVKPRKGKMKPALEPEFDANLVQDMTDNEVTPEKVKLPEQITDVEQKPVLQQYFGLWQITIAALLGGVMSGGLLISLNYRNLKERTSFIIALVISIVGQFVLLVVNAGFSYSNSHLLIMIPILIAIPVCFYMWVSELQNEDIQNEISSQLGDHRSWWMVIGVIVLSWIFVVIFNPLAEEIVWALDLPFV